MVSRRMRLGKYAPVCFANPPWNEDHPDWIRFDEWLSRDHWVRQIVEAMQVLDLTPLFASYSAGGTKPIRPDLMLRVVLIETQQGRYRPSQWFRDLRENIALMWAAFGIRPSRGLLIYETRLLEERCRESMARVPVVAALGPVIGGTLVGEHDRADAFDVFDAVFDRNRQAQRRPMFERKRSAVHLVAKQRLRMDCALDVEAHVIRAVGCRQRRVAEQVGLRLFKIRFCPAASRDAGSRDEIDQSRARPADRIAPAFDAPEFGDHVDPG